MSAASVAASYLRAMPPTRRRKLVVLSAFAMVIVDHVARSRTRPTPSSLDSSELLLLLGDRPGSGSKNGPRQMDAGEIIERSYRRTFGSLSTEAVCENVSGKTCAKSLLKEAAKISSPSSQSGTSSPSSSSFPWWFITMLRDASENSGLHGGWHNLTTLEPPMDICTIEKVATTQWRKVQCYINTGQQPKRNPTPCHPDRSSIASRGIGSRAVILRDPLERLLSGYINKCVIQWRRKREGHCEPNSVFNGTDLTAKIRDDPKQLFASYVDAFPLQWNLHFFPQSLYCGFLFRDIHQYDFIGLMDSNFYGHLHNFTLRFGTGNKLPEAMEEVFHLSGELASNSSSNVGKETQSPEHVWEYYTPASVRRALEYFAVDYVRLGLEIPGWAHNILEEDNNIF